MACSDAACGRFAALPPSEPWRLLNRCFPMCYGIQFTFPPRYADGPTARYITHMFDMRCRENGIEHRLTKIRHPWTTARSNG